MKVRTKLSFLCSSLKLALVILAPVVLLATGCGGGGSTPPPVVKTTVLVSASPASITAGDSSMLTISASNATSLTLAGSDGSSYTMSAAGGTQSVKPAATTTYTASASGAGGSAESSATVTVNVPPPPATVTIAADPASVSPGGSSTLTVVAKNATQVTVNGSDGSVYKLSATGGTQAVTPTATTTYTASVTGPGSTTAVTAKATVTVVTGPPPTVTIAAGPASIGTGGTSTLTVTATNATQVTITGSDKSSYTLAVTGGMQAVSPAATTTYTATATGTGGTVTATAVVTVTATPAATVTLSASPAAVNLGTSSTLTVVATNATAVVVTGSDKSTYTLSTTGGTQSVTPSANTTYTATATGASGTPAATATTTITVGSVQQINHVVFLLQENHSFDNYFGMLNPYRQANSTGTQPWNVGDDGNTYTVDGIDDKLDTTNESDEGDQIALFKLASSCIDDDSSAWLSSYGDANRYDFSTDRKIKMDGFVHTAEGFANSCRASGTCSGDYTEMYGERAMGYYDEDFLNYYYYMAAQFAVSDRWFSPIASKSTPNRIATYTGGTTQGLVYDPGYNDHLGGVATTDIFQVLDKAGVSWKVYYTLTQGQCSDPEDCTGGSSSYPATDLGYVYYDDKYLYQNPHGEACVAPTVGSAQIGDTSNYYCVDPTHVGPLSDYYKDVANGTLASFSFIEAGYGLNDEHPGSFQPVLLGQAAVAKVVNALMTSPSWKDSVFFFSYDEGGGPYDHVPPIPKHSNDFTDKSIGNFPDIASISVSPDAYGPCVPPGGTATQHCDLRSSDPGAHPGEVPDSQGFGGQIGFRVPNIVISPFVRRHYVSHIPMDHTAIMKFVESRFVGPTTHMTARDAAQPDLLDFFDFTATPWATPPTPPIPATDATIGHKTCNASTVGP